MEILVIKIIDPNKNDIITGEADPEVEKRSGGKHYNVKITISYIIEDKEESNEGKKESEKV